MRIVIFLMILIFPFPIHAEPVPGDSCSTYPNGTVMHSGGPELGGKIYVMSCRAGVWAAAEINPDPCQIDSPDIGITCLDGTIYAGLSPDGNTKMFAMPTNGPASSWNNGSNNYVDIATLDNCRTEPYTETSCNTGRANTSLIAALSGGSPAPYKAAQYCENLTSNGHSDWYLPARNELSLLYALHQAGKGGFMTTPSPYYWSSSEYFSSYAWQQSFTNGTQSVNANYKLASFQVRCVRR